MTRTAGFDVEVDVSAPVGVVWDALVDWPSHGTWIPLTRMRVTSAQPDGVGASFVGRTGFGPLAFDDPMVVTRWDPPEGGRGGRCDIRKTGRIVLGGAWFTVEPVEPVERAGGGARSRVHWHEDLAIAPVRLTGVLRPVIPVVGRLAFRGALRRFARRLAAQG